MRVHKYCLFSVILLLVIGCSEQQTVIQSKEERQSIDEADTRQLLRSKIQPLMLQGDPAAGRNLPDITSSPVAILGMQLFFSKALSAEKDVACVTCHHPLLGGGDGLSLPIGVDAESDDLIGVGRRHASDGEGFDGGPTVPRNSPTTFNMGLWDKTIFHDGRVESVEGAANLNGLDSPILTPDSPDRMSPDVNAANLTWAQARFPVTSPEEMKGHHKQDLNNAEIRQFLVKRLRGELNDMPLNQWLPAFQLAFQDPNGTAESLINEKNVFMSIAEYERSQVFVDTPWRDFVLGDDDAISAEAIEGALLFFSPVSQGGADCASCHTGDFFTDEGFHNIAMIQLGRGKGDGDDGSSDFGRFRVTGDEQDMFAFRTPSLLNVAVTAPYGHSGAYMSLSAVIRHHLNVEESVANYSVAEHTNQPGLQTDNLEVNTRAALERLLTARVDGASGVLTDVELTDSQVNQLIAFLNALTDKCVSDRLCLQKWIADDTVPDPDGLRLHAQFEE